jgi:hypothetical protein
VNQGPIWGRLLKKTRGQQSRATVPLKVIGQPLGTFERVLESHWEMPKCYWIASGQFSVGFGKPLGNAKIPTVSQ